MSTSTILSSLALTTVLAAQAPQLQISIGVRETGNAGGVFTSIGANGGATGSIEWVNRDVQTLTLDGTWQQFTFDLANDPISAFVGNAVLDGAFGTIEHVRILNAQGITDPIQIWIDDVVDTVNGNPTVISDFEGFASGAEVMFQEPNFSGSTLSNVDPNGPNVGGVDNLVASRSSSGRYEFRFVDGTPTRWVRLTTFNATNVPNPQIRFDQGSVVTFFMRGGKCQRNLGFATTRSTAIAEMCGRGLAAGQRSTYYTAGVPAGALGVLAISLSGGSSVELFPGSTLVSFSNYLFDLPLIADLNGRLALTLPGTAGVFDLTFQSGYLDPNATFGLALTNALNVEMGR